MRAHLEAEGWQPADGHDFDLAWLDHVPSRAWLRGLAPHQHVNQLTGIGALLEPEARQRAWAAGMGRRRRLAHACAWPRTYALPEERDALAAAPGDHPEVLLLRRVDSAFEERWRVVAAEALDESTVAMARPLRRHPEDRIVESIVLLRSVRPLVADLHGVFAACRWTGTLPQEPDYVCDPALHERIVGEIREATRAALAWVREDLLDARTGDFCVLAFEWHVGPAGRPELLDVHARPALGSARESAAPTEGTDASASWIPALAARLGLVEHAPARAEEAFVPLWPADAQALSHFPAPRLEDAEAAGVEMPAGLASRAWTCRPSEAGVLDDLPVLHHDETASLLPLDGLGAFVWVSCAQGLAPRQIIDEMVEAYDEPPARVAQDVWALLATWAHRGLIAHADDDDPPVPVRRPSSDGETGPAAILAIGERRVALRGATPLLLSVAREMIELTVDEEEVPCPPRSVTVHVESDADGRWRIRHPRPSPWLPGVTWLAPELQDQLMRAAVWSDDDALALRGALVRHDGGTWMLLSAHTDLLHRVVAEAVIAGVRILSAPYVPVGPDGRLESSFAGGLAVADDGDPGILAHAAAWREARPHPRILKAPVRLLPLAARSATEEPRAPEAFVFLDAGDGDPSRREPVGAVDALARLVRDGVPPGCRIGSAQARALVACLEKTERWRMTLPRAAGAWAALSAGESA